MQHFFEQVFEFFPNLCHAYPLVEKVGEMAKNVTELPDGPAGEHGLTARQLKKCFIVNTRCIDS